MVRRFQSRMYGTAGHGIAGFLMRARTATGAALVALLSLITAWLLWPPNNDRRIRRRLTALADEFNSSTSDGLGLAAKAVRIGDYFTNDVIVDLGEGSSTIVGRDTLMGMAARLQPRTAGPAPRTAAFTLRVADITVDAAGGWPDRDRRAYVDDHPHEHRGPRGVPGRARVLARDAQTGRPMADRPSGCGRHDQVSLITES